MTFIKPERFTSTCPQCQQKVSAMSVRALKDAKDQHEHYHQQQRLQEPA
jgi:hypothetical protein